MREVQKTGFPTYRLEVSAVPNDPQKIEEFLKALRILLEADILDLNTFRDSMTLKAPQPEKSRKDASGKGVEHQT